MESTKIIKLPIKKCNSGDLNWSTKDIYEGLGFKIIKEIGWFYNVEIPSSWELKDSDHGMWSHLYDDKGRERMSIFKKFSSHDTDVFVNIHCKIKLRVDRLGFINGNYEQDELFEYTSSKTPFCGVVLDYDESFLFKTKEVNHDIEYDNENGRKGYTEEYKQRLWEIEPELEAECNEFLKDNYPEYRNPLKYWDEQ